MFYISIFSFFFSWLAITGQRQLKNRCLQAKLFPHILKLTNCKTRSHHLRRPFLHDSTRFPFNWHIVHTNTARMSTRTWQSTYNAVNNSGTFLPTSRLVGQSSLTETVKKGLAGLKYENEHQQGDIHALTRCITQSYYNCKTKCFNTDYEIINTLKNGNNQNVVGKMIPLEGAL